MIWLRIQLLTNSFRCADKILTQLEIHADAAIANNGTANRKMMASLKSDSVLFFLLLKLTCFLTLFFILDDQEERNYFR